MGEATAPVDGVHGNRRGLQHRVLVCDARPLVRLGLATAIAREHDLQLSAVSGTSADIIELLVRVKPQLAIVDTRSLLQGALVLLPTLCECFPDVQLLMLCEEAEPMLAAELLRAGAAGVIHSSQPLVEILEAIRSTLRGSSYLPPSINAAEVDVALRESPIQALTPREREIFALLGRGYSNTEIARHLFISSRTVETHRQRVMTKLGLHSIIELVRIAVTLEMAGWSAVSQPDQLTSS